MHRLLPIALAVLAPCAAFAVTGDKAEFRKVADGVYAFVGKRNDANALVVVTAQGVVLVDTGNNPPETRILQGFIRSVTDQPVRYVVVTQNHGDHTGGTALFSPSANVIVHERVARDWPRGSPTRSSPGASGSASAQTHSKRSIRSTPCSPSQRA